MFQSRLGRKIKKAADPPIQIHGFKNTRRCGVSKSPTTIPKANKAIEYFSCKPIPATTPNQSQYRGSLRLIASTAKYAQPIHKLGSKQLVPSKLPFERYCGAIRTAIALSAKANRRPPNSRASKAVCTTSREEANAGINRTLRSESPRIARQM